jgi:hypothetical protein
MPPKPIDLRSLLLSQRQSLGSSGLISLKSSGLTSLAKLGPQRKLRILDISQNPIKSLDSLESQESLAEVIADDTQLEDFKGLDRHPKLAKFSAVGTPLSNRGNFRLSSLIVIGPLLSFINGTAVATSERDQIRRFPKIVRYLLQAGWELEFRDISEEEYKRMAQERGVKVNGKPFDELSKAEIKALFRMPMLLKSKQELEREVNAYVEETLTQAKRTEEQAEEALANEIAQQLGRIGVNVKAGPKRKEEILTALGGLAEVVRVLEEVGDVDQTQDLDVDDEQEGELND